MTYLSTYRENPSRKKIKLDHYKQVLTESVVNPPEVPEDYCDHDDVTEEELKVIYQQQDQDLAKLNKVL